MRTVLVLSGNSEQTMNFIKKVEFFPFHFYHISEAFMIHRFNPNDTKYIRVGTWYSRRDIDEIENILKSRGFEEIVYKEEIERGEIGVGV